MVVPAGSATTIVVCVFVVSLRSAVTGVFGIVGGALVGIVSIFVIVCAFAGAFVGQ